MNWILGLSLVNYYNDFMVLYLSKKLQCLGVEKLDKAWSEIYGFSSGIGILEAYLKGGIVYSTFGSWVQQMVLSSRGSGGDASIWMVFLYIYTITIGRSFSKMPHK